MRIPIQYNVGTEIVETKALIDSGAGGHFICEEEAWKLKKPWTRLEKPIKVFNVDGTRNKIGWITHSVTIDITIGDRLMKETLLISGLGPERVILGLPWLQDHNPDIDWVTGVVHFRPRRKIMVKRLMKPFIGILDETKELDTGILDKVEDDEVLIWSFIKGEEDSDEVRINAKLSASQVLAQAHEVKAKPLEELLPPYLSDYSDRFEKKKAERFPPSRPYDHMIDLKLDFKPRDSKIFMKLDLRNGYNNIRIKDGDQWKAVFKTPRGLFEPTVMFFGSTNSPATFQAFMNDILKDFIDKGWCVVYMDDILIFSDKINIHRLRTRHVLERLRENDLYLKLEKCEFEVMKMLFLGMVITPGHISMDETKLAGIKDWEVPKTIKGVRSFLGFANFYCKFIGKYAELVRPLHELTKKDTKFEWTKLRDVAFNVLKVKFLQQPILQMPDDEKPFIIEADASKWATGAVLKQQGSDGELHPCGYISHAFTATERNYEIYDHELLAIMNALKAWEHYLLGGAHPVTVLSDHKNLTYFWTAQKLNRRQARLSLYLTQFNLRLVHVPGTKMVQSDALSRRPDLVDEEENDNDDIVMLPDKLFVNSLIEKGTPPIKSSLQDWRTKGNLLFYKDRIYVPNDATLRQLIVKTIHEALPHGHPGQWNTVDQVQRDYWWLGMTKFIKSFVDGCAACQQMKVNTHPTRTPIQPIGGHKDVLPFQIISMDLITDLPKISDYDSILVVVNHAATKGVIFIPCHKKIDATDTAELLFQHVYKRFGLPDKIISDRDPRFAAEVFKEMGKLLGIKQMLSTAYHPQTDGETERVNQEVEIFLRFFCAKEQTKWKDLLHFAEFAHNTRTHSVTKNSPFYLMMGYHPRPLPTVFEKTTVPSVEKRVAELKKLREETSALLDIAARRVKERRGKNLDKFEKGQKVWLEGKNLSLGYPSPKLSPKREGPFEITEVLGPVTYKLKLPFQWRIHPVFHAGLLSPFKETDVHGPNFLEPPPDIVEGQEEYEVEAIIRHRPKRKNQPPKEYLVSWKGYDSSHNQWLKPAGLKHSMELYLAYKIKYNLR
uniref:RNA-directed DNA polymerase n=1 Tax=Moniliophthora roreri TaxID=221103 RepID=A0A0W0GEF0_MONRR